MPPHRTNRKKTMKEGIPGIGHRTSTGTIRKESDNFNVTTTTTTTTTSNTVMGGDSLMPVQPQEFHFTSLLSTVTSQFQRQALEETVNSSTGPLDQAAPVLQMSRMLPEEGRTHTQILDGAPDGGAGGLFANTNRTGETEMGTSRLPSGFTNREIIWLAGRASRFEGLRNILNTHCSWFDMERAFKQQFPGHGHSKSELYEKWVMMVSDMS